MGIKLLSLNMISWSCFQLFKNHMLSCIQLQPSEPIDNIKLIDSDGLVKIYDRPIHVSELMLEFPKHLVCRSDSFYIGQKIPPLSENDQLQLGHKYFLLPKHFFQSVLSFVTIASFFASSPHHQHQHQLQHPFFSPLTKNNNNFLKKAASCQQPFDIQRTPSGCLRIRVSDEFISRLVERGKMISSDGGEAEGSKICTTPQLVKDYTQLVRRRKWKPKLETIRESQRRRLSSFGMRKRKSTSQSKATGSHSCTTSTRSEYRLHHRLSSMKFSSKPKIRVKSRI